MKCDSSNSSTVDQPQASGLSGILTRLQQSIAQRTRIATLRLSLGLGVGCWCISAAAIPQIAQAYTARVNLTLDRQSTETYDTLLRRAEAAGRAAVQRSFDQDILVTDVAVIIVAQNQGQIAPILSLQVSRPQWSRRPDAQSWTNYFPNAQLLLGLQQVAATTPTQTSTTSPASSTIRRPYRSFQPGIGTTTPSTGGILRPSSSIVVPGQPTNGTPAQSGNGVSGVTPQTPAPGAGIAPIPATPAFVPPTVNPQQTPTSPVNSVPNNAIPSFPGASQVLPPITGGTTVNQSAPTNSGGVPGISPSTPTQNQ